MSNEHDDIPVPPSWTHQDTMDYLTANPLPVSFFWIHRDPGEDGKPKLESTKNQYAIKGGYGKWLHDTPYFPGLFELIHDLLFHSGPRLPDIEELVNMLERIKRDRMGQGTLDLA